MDNDDIDRHPDLRGLDAPSGFGLRARWQARRNRARLVKQWRSPDVSRQQRRRTTALIAGIIVAAIGAVAVATYWNDITGQSQADERAPRTPPSTTATKYVPNATVDLTQPFVGTPAAGWRNGIAGIRAPKAKAVGDFDAAEVARAIQDVRKSIAAAYLNRRVIVKHDVGPFLRTLAPYSSAQLKGTPKADYVVLVHPDYRLLPAHPKSKGTFTVKSTQPGELIVRAKFVVAYAFDIDAPERLRDALDIVAVIKSDLTFRVYAGPRWDQNTHGVQLGGGKTEMFAMSCKHARMGYLAPYYADRSTTEGLPEQEPGAYFDPAKPITLTGGCAD